MVQNSSYSKCSVGILLYTKQIFQLSLRHGRNYNEAKASYRNWPLFFVKYNFFFFFFLNRNLYSDRNDIHWMNSFNVYSYRLKSTNIVAMKDITDLPWCNVYCHLVSRWHSSHVSKKTGWRRVGWKESHGKRW